MVSGYDKTNLPSSILFACTHNMIRSPMAAAMMKDMFHEQITVDSCGINAGSSDGFTIAVMQEVGLDLADHTPKNFDRLEDSNVDMVICFSKDSFERAKHTNATKSCLVELWPIYDPALVAENRNERVRAYRYVRDTIRQMLVERFVPQKQ